MFWLNKNLKPMSKKRTEELKKLPIMRKLLAESKRKQSSGNDKSNKKKDITI